ncbi:MAG: hypothetical protein NTW21_10405 [Verrucomicrobia bacterium]|nr:hypothetical protein [Verrucomicrobiota bacterium]
MKFLAAMPRAAAIRTTGSRPLHERFERAGIPLPWVFEVFVHRKRAEMTPGEIVADGMPNQGRQTREWPDFGCS